MDMQTQGRASYPLNAWYVAGWADEVQQTPVARRLLDRDVVLFRGEDRVAAALSDMCPHRFAPLSKGQVHGDLIACPYHGLEFDRAGACVRNPSGGGQFPAGTRVRAFPLIERHRMLWIWMGDAARADPGLIPDLHQVPVAGAGHQNLGNHLLVKVNYQLEIDNIMDLTHANFLHMGSLGNESMRKGEVRARDEGESICADLWMPETICPFGELEGHIVDQWYTVRWFAPAVMTLEFGAVPVGQPRQQDPHTIAFHIFTPESETQTHYFFGTSCAYGEDEAWKAAWVREAQNRAFLTEDNPMVEAIARNMAGRDFWSMRPAILPSDTGAILVRRRLERLCRNEIAPAADTPDAA